MNLVGELVLARNQILQFTKTQDDSTFISTSQRLNIITSELQESVMRTRMQPIANVWNKFPRVVRDVSRMCGKDVELAMEGKDTELDKTILEAIKDPLTHLVRNAVDHGIEMPDIREQHGKPRQGSLVLRAYHEGGHVIIEIEDNGGGLATDRIRDKAIEKGLISVEQSRKMSETEIHRLIFAAGFSTAEKVTNLSGRGVGMDVVKSNIERIGGSVDVASKQREGTTVTIKIPLTLAIIPALIVSSGQNRFAVPQVSLLELVRIPGEERKRLVENIQGASFYRLRGNLLPLVFLNRELELNERSGNAERELNLVVVKADEQQFGLVIDEVHDTEEIVVKPLGRQLKDISVYAGATIMGDGKIALIIDVAGLARKSKLSTRASVEKELATEGTKSAGTLQTLLIVKVGGDRMAIPLAMVNRLEEFDSSLLERAGGRIVVQYRGGILPLIELSGFFSTQGKSASDGQVHVVVYSKAGATTGLVVDEILDIVEEDATILHKNGSRPGTLGSSIIQKRVTDLLNVDEIIQVALEASASKHTSILPQGAEI